MRIELCKKLIIGTELDSEHSYIFDSKKDLRLIYWQRDISGKEKPELLGWEPKRILKTLFLQDGSPKIYGFVLPLDQKLETRPLAELLEISRSKASKLRFAEKIPYLHKPGSIAPFICDKDLGLVSKIIFSQEKFDDFVDFSYPGRADISLHMRYQDAIDILMQKYPQLIKMGELEYRIKTKKEMPQSISGKKLIIGPDGFVCSEDSIAEDFDGRYYWR